MPPSRKHGVKHKTSLIIFLNLVFFSFLKYYFIYTYIYIFVWLSHDMYICLYVCGVYVFLKARKGHWILRSWESQAFLNPMMWMLGRHLVFLISTRHLTTLCSKTYAFAFILPCVQESKSTTSGCCLRTKRKRELPDFMISVNSSWKRNHTLVPLPARSLSPQLTGQPLSFLWCPLAELLNLNSVAL